MSHTATQKEAVVSLEVHPDLANVTSRKEHFSRWADATEKARDIFEVWLFNEDGDASVTPPRQNRQSTPVFTVRAAPDVIHKLCDASCRPNIVADVEVPPARFGLVHPEQ